MNQIDVRASKHPSVLVILLGLFFVPVGLWNLLTGLLDGFKVVSLGIGIMSLVMFGVVVWLVRRGHSRSIKYLSEEGLVRNDGRSFAWADLIRVVDRVRVRPSGKKFLWRTEIQFKDSEAAWVIPAKVRDYEKLAKLIRRLPCEHTEERA